MFTVLLSINPKYRCKKRRMLWQENLRWKNRVKDNSFLIWKQVAGRLFSWARDTKQKNGAENSVKSVKTNAPNDARYDRKTSANGKVYFVLKAANGEIIGTSEMYSSESVRDNGIESVKTNAPDAGIDDLT